MILLLPAMWKLKDQLAAFEEESSRCGTDHTMPDPGRPLAAEQSAGTTRAFIRWDVTALNSKL